MPRTRNRGKLTTGKDSDLNRELMKQVLGEVLVSSPDHTFQAKCSLVINYIILGFC